MPQGHLSLTVNAEHVKKCLKHVPTYYAESGAKHVEFDIGHEMKGGVLYMYMESVVFTYERD